MTVCLSVDFAIVRPPTMMIDAHENHTKRRACRKTSAAGSAVCPWAESRWRHTFRALRHRNYRLFFWGQLVSLIGTWMQQTAMSWFVYQITNSKLLLGVVAAVGSAPMMLSSIWGGSLADLYPKRSILVATQAAQMICAFLLAAGVWLGFATTSVHHHRRCAQRNCDGVRHAGAPGVSQLK